MAGDHLPRTDPEVQLSFDNGEPLLLLRMRMAAGHPTTGGEHEFPRQQGAVGLVCGPVNDDPLTGDGIFDDVFTGSDDCLLAGRPRGDQRCQFSQQLPVRPSVQEITFAVRQGEQYANPM